MTHLPEPLTPPDCDLRAMTFIPLDIIRLFGSEFHALSTDAEWRAGLTLWLKSWHQVPAASLPDDDIQLTRHAELGRDLKSWSKIRAGALRGWVKCSDGRLYHPVVSDKALDAWARRSEWQEREENRTTRQQRWRARCKLLSEQLRDAGVTPPRGASLETLEAMVLRLQGDGKVDGQASTHASTVDAVEIGKTGTGTGTGTGTDKPLAGASGERPPEASTGPDKPEKKPRKKPSIALPDDFPGAAEADHAVAESAKNAMALDFADEAARFRDYHAGKGNLMADWPAAWRTWIRNAIKFTAERDARAAAGPNPRRLAGRGGFSAMAYAAQVLSEDEDYR